MIISTFKKALLLGSFTICMTAAAMPANLSCGCNDTKAIKMGCDAKSVNGPSWWGWLTNNHASQFHFFDLVELLHDDEVSYENDKKHLDKVNS